MALPPAFERVLTPEDRAENSTLQSFERVTGQLETVSADADRIDTILDVGCGTGGLAAALGEHLGATTVYGVDVDATARERAAERGVEPLAVDVETEPLPLEDGSVDLAVTFGLLEHLRYYDTHLAELRRVLGNDGWCWVATPNLGGWTNRLSLLTGHQPRNVEVSSERAVGTLSVYPPDEFLDHVHAPTYGALLEVLELHGLEPVDAVGLRPYQRSTLVRVLDTLLGWRTSWARRVAVLARPR